MTEIASFFPFSYFQLESIESHIHLGLRAGTAEVKALLVKPCILFFW